MKKQKCNYKMEELVKSRVKHETGFLLCTQSSDGVTFLGLWCCSAMVLCVLWPSPVFLQDSPWVIAGFLKTCFFDFA